MAKAFIERLQSSVKGQTEIEFQRHFRASPDALFSCHTEAKLIQKWLTGPPAWVFEHCKVDLRVGGTYLYIWSHPQNGRFGMMGFFKELETPFKIVNTEIFLPDPDQINENAIDESLASWNWLSFTKDADRTLMKLVCRYPNADIRKTALDSGMSDGMEMSYQKLDQLLTGMK